MKNIKVKAKDEGGECFKEKGESFGYIEREREKHVNEGGRVHLGLI